MEEDNAADDLAAFGAPPDVIADVKKATEEDSFFEIWEDNYESLLMFTRLQTQWNVLNGVFLGLNYPSVAALLTIYGTQNPASTMDDLIAMEHAVLPILNKREG